MNPGTVERFLEEARTVLSLQHANIVPVFDFGRDSRGLYLVMEWIDGCDLAVLLAWLRARRETLPPLVAAHVAAEVCKALTYAHQHRGPSGQPGGILHRDVTPRNLLLSRQGEVRLTDFGIAGAVSATNAPGGTPRYLAPEAARGELIDARSDLYSLGLVLAEMLLGQPLRERATMDDARRPAEIPAFTDVPDPIAAVARRLLASDPSARFGSASEAHDALAVPLASEILRGGPQPAQLLAQLVQRQPEQPADGALSAANATEASETRTGPASAPPRSRGRRTLFLGAASATVTGALALWGLRRSRSELASSAPVERSTIGRADARPQTAIAPAAQAARESAIASPPAAEPAPARTRRAPATPTWRKRASARLRITAPGSWVAVYLDGQKLTDDAGEFDIPPGRHHLRVENPPMHFYREEWIVVHSGQSLTREFHPAP
jgi:serine/threonine protein kinase